MKTNVEMAEIIFDEIIELYNYSKNPLTPNSGKLSLEKAWDLTKILAKCLNIQDAIIARYIIHNIGFATLLSDIKEA